MSHLSARVHVDTLRVGGTQQQTVIVSDHHRNLVVKTMATTASAGTTTGATNQASIEFSCNMPTPHPRLLAKSEQTSVFGLWTERLAGASTRGTVRPIAPKVEVLCESMLYMRRRHSLK
jgi:hypothetical protein